MQNSVNRALQYLWNICVLICLMIAATSLPVQADDDWPIGDSWQTDRGLYRLSLSIGRLQNVSDQCDRQRCPRLTCSEAAQNAAALHSIAQLMPRYIEYLEASKVAHFDHWRTLVATSLNTTESLARAQYAQAWHQTLHDGSKMLADISSMMDSFRSLRNKREIDDWPDFFQTLDTIEQRLETAAKLQAQASSKLTGERNEQFYRTFDWSDLNLGRKALVDQAKTWRKISASMKQWHQSGRLGALDTAFEKAVREHWNARNVPKKFWGDDNFWDQREGMRKTFLSWGQKTLAVISQSYLDARNAHMNQLMRNAQIESDTIRNAFTTHRTIARELQLAQVMQNNVNAALIELPACLQKAECSNATPTRIDVEAMLHQEGTQTNYGTALPRLRSALLEQGAKLTGLQVRDICNTAASHDQSKTCTNVKGGQIGVADYKTLAKVMAFPGRAYNPVFGYYRLTLKYRDKVHYSSVVAIGSGKDGHHATNQAEAGPCQIISYLPDETKPFHIPWQDYTPPIGRFDSDDEGPKAITNANHFEIANGGRTIVYWGTGVMGWISNTRTEFTLNARSNSLDHYTGWWEVRRADFGVGRAELVRLTPRITKARHHTSLYRESHDPYNRSNQSQWKEVTLGQGPIVLEADNIPGRPVYFQIQLLGENVHGWHAMVWKSSENTRVKLRDLPRLRVFSLEHSPSVAPLMSYKNVAGALVSGVIDTSKTVNGKHILKMGEIEIPIEIGVNSSN